MRNTLLITILAFFSIFSFGQTVVMGGANTTACNGVFVDPGGTGNYANNENITWTLCPDVPGTQLQLNFTTFNTENFDQLTIYNGSTTTAATLGTYAGGATGDSPGVVQADNATGCLTFVFTSDGSVTNPGWTADISCSLPCQDIVPVVVGSPAISSGTYIDVCQGQNFTLFGDAVYPQNNTGYTQSNATSTFTWTTSDGGSFVGQTFVHSIANPGIFQVDLEIEDVNGCVSTIDIDLLVRVSPDPIFAGTNVTNPIICLGETNTLTGVVTPQEIELDCTPPIAGTTFLPDGSGVSYSTSVAVDCFGPGQTFNAASDLQEVCVTMEHSYLGDLELELICPGGTGSITLKAYPGGGGTYLGDPIDQAPEGPGTGSQYCFDMASADLLVNGPTIPAGTPAGNSVQPGSYLPVDGFAGLIGCPLNGDWTINITDNLGSDDGYIFGWNMSFDPAILPPIEQDLVSITSESWQADPTITATTGNTITVEPTAAGTSCYTYQVTDEYGCNYDTTICFTVLPPTDPACPQCLINNFTANIGACASGSYTTTGTVEFINPPSTGTLTVSDCDGNQQVFNAPFVSPLNYSISGQDPDGGACNMTAVFSAEPACTQNLPYTAPTCPCFIASVNANIEACDPNDNTFTVSGDFSYSGNPGSGTFIVEITNSSGTQTQVFNAPFSDGTVYNYSIPGNISDGSPLTINYYFSDNTACSFTQTSVSPPGCFCEADAGTYTDNVVGNSNATGPHELCFGDDLSILSNGDYDPPQDMTANNPGAVYDPGLWLLAFSCPPTVSSPTPLGNDPCYLGVASNNNGTWTISNNSGGYNAVYFVPVTMYSMSDGVYAVGINNGDLCYDLGPAFPVIPLDEIVSNTVQDCQAGTATVTLSGGMPGYDGSNFTASNLSPASASFDNTTAGNNGTITISGLNDGDNWSFDVVDSKGCPHTVTGTFVGTQDASFTYPQIAYCQDEANPTPTITGVPGGTFSSTSGIVLNTASGLINLAGSTPGTYTVTYQSPDPICFETATFDVTINPLPTVDGNDETICAGDQVTLNGTGADTYTWTGGVTDGVAFTPGATTTYTVTGTITATGCQNTGTATVTVTPLDDPSFTMTDFCEGTAAPVANITGLGGGSFAFNPAVTDGATINAASGVISNGVGGTNYTVEYTTNGACPQSSTQTVTVNPLPNVVANDVSVCIGGNVTISASGATTYNWDNGLGAGASHSVSPAVNTTYTVTGTDANGCVNTDNMTVTILANAPINAGVDQTICNGESANLTATGGITYTWDNGLGTGANHTVSPTVTTTYSVTGQDANGCSGTDNVTITVLPLPTATIAGTTTICQNEANPTVTFTGANGTAPYTFTYSLNGGANQTVASVGNVATITVPSATAGTFTYSLVSVADASANNCSQPQAGTAVITINPLPLASLVGGATVCQNDAEPIMTFTGTNGTAPYTFTYTLNNGVNQTVVSNAAGIATVNVPTNTAGTFTYDLVSVQDANGCSQAQTGSGQVIVNPLPTGVIAGATTICVGDPNPSVTFTGANGTAPYTFTYTLNGGGNQTVTSVGNIATVNINSAVAGTYDYVLVSVQDANGCIQTQTGNATVIVNPLPTATIAGTALVCQNDAQPTITFTGANGTAPYTFTYNINGGGNLTVTSVGDNATVTAPTGTAGVFTYNLVSVSDASATNCSQNQFGSAVVTVNPLPTATISGTATICENDPQPTITFTGANGTAPYTFTYNLNGGTLQTIVSVGNTATITIPSTPVGTYNYNLVSVQDASSTNCSQPQTGTATIVVNPNPTPVINGVMEYCTGTTATLNTNVAYNSYNWSTGVTTPTAIVTTLDNPITVTVTNAFGCSATSPAVNVLENTVITFNSQIEICQGGSALIHGLNQTTAGTYSQTFTLPTGCDSTSNVTLIVNPLPVINPGAPQTLCADEQVTLNATGAPTLVWDNGVFNGIPFTQAVGTVTYTATGTDVNGCVNSASVNVTVNPTPNATITGNSTVCQNDAEPTVTFIGSGGTAPYTFTYSINGGGVQTVTSVGNNATVNVPTNTVGSFVYNLTNVADASATICEQVLNESVTIIVNPLPTASISGDAEVCQNDTEPVITFTGADGTAPYTFTYTINGGAQQTVTSTGNNATVTAPTNIVGTFVYDLVSVMDASATNCTQAQTGSATVIVNPLPLASIGGDVTVCVDDAEPVVTISGNNGTAPYTFYYNINNGVTLSVISDLTGIATLSVPTNAAGTFTYNLTAVDDASASVCSSPINESVTILVNPLPTATIAGDVTVCLNDTDPVVTFTGNDGTAPYTFTYTINGGAPLTVVSDASGIGTVSAPTNTDGTFVYELTSVSDASATNCTQVQNGTATVIVNPLPTGTIAGSVDVCHNDAEPMVTFTGNDGTSPYTFTYTINGGTPQTVTSDLTGVVSVSAPTDVVGSFIYNLINVEDASATNCSQAVDESITINVNSIPTATIAGDVELCIDSDEPLITLTGSNGVEPYTFTYNVNGGGDQTITSVGPSVTISVPTNVAGTFNFNLINVVDASTTTCSQNLSETSTVVVNELPNVYAGGDFVTCENDNAILTASGAETYQWNNGVTDGVLFAPTETLDYVVIGTDENGCENSDTVTVVVEPLPAVSFFGDTTMGCNPLTVTFTNTTPGDMVDCIWTIENGDVLTGCDEVTAVIDEAGEFDVTLTTTSSNGCTNTVTYTDYLFIEDVPNAAFTVSSSEVSELDPTVEFNNTSTGATSYVWDFGDDSPNSNAENPEHLFPAEAPESYVVELFAYSNLGCVDSTSRVIKVVEELIFFVPNTFTPDGDDFNEAFTPVFTSGFDPYDYQLLIFNRWGEIIFESRNAEIGWPGTYNGEIMQDGTYTWKITFATSGDAKDKRQIVGHVNLLR